MASPDIDEIRSVLVNALKHYQQRLNNLATTDETVQLGNDIIKKDLEENAKEAGIVANHLEQVDVVIRAAQNRRYTVMPALNCYVADLKKSKDTLPEKLGGANPNLMSVDREIAVAEYFMQSLNS